MTTDPRHTERSCSFSRRTSRPTSRSTADFPPVHPWLAGVLAALCHTAPFAQTATDTAAEPTLPAVRVQSDRTPALGLTERSDTGSRLGITVLQTPASVQVLDGDTVRARGDTSVSAAVSRAPGITASPSPGNGGTSLAARGFGGHGSVMTLFDGTRLYVASGTITFPFDPWSVDRIEVLSGAASVMFGEGAVGGAVNIVPKKPTRDPVRSEARFAAGSDHTRRVAVGSGGAIDDHWSYRVDASHQRSDGFMARGDSESFAIGGALRLDVSPQLNVTLSRDDGHQLPERYQGIPLIDGRVDDRNARQNYNVADAELKYRDTWTRLDTHWTPTDRIAVRNQLYHLNSQRFWKNAETYTFVPATSTVRRDDYLTIDHDQEQTGTRTDASVQQTVFGLNNRVAVGFDVNRISFQHTNDSPYGGTSTVDAFVFDPGHYVSPSPLRPGFRATTHAMALFAEDRLALTDTLSIVGGLRWDHADTHRTDLRTGVSFDKTFVYRTWRLGAVYAPNDLQSFYASYATSADPLGALITTSLAQSAFDLATAKQVEVGYKQSLPGGQGAWTVAAYRIEKKNLLTRSSPTAPQQQIGQQSSRGVEVSVSLKVLRTVRFDANAARLDARYGTFNEVDGAAFVSRAGNTPVNVPEAAANAWVTWTFLPSWDATAGVRHVGPRQINTANTRQIGSYTVADLSLGWKVQKNLALKLLFTNVFDRTYALSTSNAGNQWLLGRPRAAELVANVGF